MRNVEWMAHRPDANGANRFDLTGRVAVVTGGTGALGRAIVAGLAGAGAEVVVVTRRAGEGGRSVTADVTDRDSLVAAAERVVSDWGRVDVLVNAAGGNTPAATVPPDGSLLDLDADAVRAVVDLNFQGTLNAIQAFGRPMTEQRSGSIINISSMAASRPLSRVGGYGAAKAAVENLTRWLADHMGRRFGEGIRVNAIAPGFFLGDQNRDLLIGADGSYTERARRIIAGTPMGRLGQPDDLIGTVIWLASDASRFVTGVVVPVDGGFSVSGGP